MPDELLNAQPTFRIGTRGSPLALAQTRLVAARLGDASRFETVVIKTTGDIVQDRPLAQIGGKGLFTKEIDDAMLAGSIDLAVHSMKDLPTVLPEGIRLACVLRREDPRDAFIALNAAHLDEVPQGAVIGTASLRRSAQILAARPDLRIVPLRGNVQTRLKKLAEGQVDATILAVAGLKRLGMEDHISSIFEISAMLPAVAQGAIGVTCREDDARALALLEPANDSATMIETTAERAFLRVLDGSCRTPIAALAQISGDVLCLEGLIISPDGKTLYRTRHQGSLDHAEAIGEAAAYELKDRAGEAFTTLFQTSV